MMQDDVSTPSAPVASAVPAPRTRAKPAATVAYVRPPPGLARGEHDAPGWVVGSAALGLMGFVVGFFVIRHRRAQRRRVYESVAPKSSRR